MSEIIRKLGLSEKFFYEGSRLHLWNQAYLLTIEGMFPVNLFREAVNILKSNHILLNTQIVSYKNEYLFNKDPAIKLMLTFHDNNKEKYINSTIDLDILRDFPESESLIRIHAFKDSTGKNITHLLLTIHHSIADTSIAIKFIQDILELCNMIGQGRNYNDLLNQMNSKPSDTYWEKHIYDSIPTMRKIWLNFKQFNAVLVYIIKRKFKKREPFGHGKDPFLAAKNIDLSDPNTFQDLVSKVKVSFIRRSIDSESLREILEYCKKNHESIDHLLHQSAVQTIKMLNLTAEPRIKGSVNFCPLPFIDDFKIGSFICSYEYIVNREKQIPKHLFTDNDLNTRAQNIALLDRNTLKIERIPTIINPPIADFHIDNLMTMDFDGKQPIQLKDLYLHSFDDTLFSFFVIKPILLNGTLNLTFSFPPTIKNGNKQNQIVDTFIKIFLQRN